MERVIIPLRNVNCAVARCRLTVASVVMKEKKRDGAVEVSFFL
jgi:hypothetical protein